MSAKSRSPVFLVAGIVVLIAAIAGAYLLRRPRLPEQGTTQYAEMSRTFYRGLAALEVGLLDSARQDFARATQIVPGSHGWSDEAIARLLREIDFSTAPEGERRPRPAGPLPEAFRGQVQDVTMHAGAAVIFLGTLVHRGGENRSAAPRLALSNQYCEPWARQQENYFLSLAPETVRGMSPRVQALLGYSIHPPFMGHVNGLHPRRTLERGYEPPS